MTIIQVYAPISSDDDTDEFYTQLKVTLDKGPKTDFVRPVRSGAAWLRSPHQKSVWMERKKERKKKRREKEKGEEKKERRDRSSKAKLCIVAEKHPPLELSKI